MDPRIKSRLTPAVVAEAAARFESGPGDPVDLGGFESLVLEAQVAGRRAVIRIGHGRRRPPPLVAAELHWLEYLAAAGIGVASPLRSASGALVESIPDGHGEEFVAAAFAWATGAPPTAEQWSHALWDGYGALVGRIHAATDSYRPPVGAPRRPEWDDPALLDVAAFLPAAELEARTAFARVLAHLRTLPRDAGYGLVHHDAHGGNLLVDGRGRLTLLDFDDCCYSWFADDLAVVLFYALSWADAGREAEHAAAFWPAFVAGYRREQPAKPPWLAEIPHFMKLREIDTYAVIHRSMDVARIADPWAAWFMQGRRERIAAQRPVVEIDFEGPWE